MSEPFAYRPLLRLLHLSLRQFACLGHFTEIRGRDALDAFAVRWLQVFGPLLQILANDPEVRALFHGRPLIEDRADRPDEAPAAGYFDAAGAVMPQQFLDSLLAFWHLQFDGAAGADLDELRRATVGVMRAAGFVGALDYVLDLLAHGVVINAAAAGAVLIELLAPRRELPEDLEYLLAWTEREASAAGAAASLDEWTLAHFALRREIDAVRQVLEHFGCRNEPPFAARTTRLEEICADGFARIESHAGAGIEDHHPYVAEARYQAGLLQDFAGDHAGAVRVFMDCILLDPGNWMYWQSLAVGMKAEDSSDQDVMLVKATAALLQDETP